MDVLSGSPHGELGSKVYSTHKMTYFFGISPTSGVIKVDWWLMSQQPGQVITWFTDGGCTQLLLQPHPQLLRLFLFHKLNCRAVAVGTEISGWNFAQPLDIGRQSHLQLQKGHSTMRVFMPMYRGRILRVIWGEVSCSWIVLDPYRLS